MAIRAVREKEGKPAPEFPEVPAAPTHEELAGFPRGYNVLGQEVALAGAGGWIQEAPPGVGLNVQVGRKLVLSQDWQESIRAQVAYGTSYRRGEEEVKPPPSLLAFDVDQVVQAPGLAPVGHTPPAPAGHTAPAGATSQAGASSGVENPRTTHAEHVRDNVDPVVSPGGVEEEEEETEESRDFDLGVS